MKTIIFVFLTVVFCLPMSGPAQQSAPGSNDIQIELSQESEFVVKIMDVIDKSGNKIQGPVGLESFSVEEKVFIFKKSNGKMQKLSDQKISKIVFNRLRQGVLTGKPSSLRVNVWNGKIKNFELNYSSLRIEDGYLFISQNELLNHFDDADTLRANSDEWSEKFHNFWKKIKEDSPEVFSTDFAFKNGHGIISHKMAAAYCRTCLKIEILNLKIDPETETVLVRCKKVFYDKYNE